MLSAADNALLTQTGPHTPMGSYFRHFWQPVALSCEVPEPDCAPIRVRILGEDLVAFRDTEGRVGLVDWRCPHREADMFYGRNEECGLRCVYHGWKFDADGQCMDLPNVPPEAAAKMKVTIKAYPTQEYGEMVWAYLGPGEPPEAVPAIVVGQVPAEQRHVIKKLQACNWAQAIEGALDTCHFSFLHMPAPTNESNENPLAQADLDRNRWLRNDPQPQFHFIDHDSGFLIGGARRADGDETYWRTTHFMLPSHATTPSTNVGETHFGYSFIPIDDESCWIYTYGWNPERAITDEERAKFKSGFGVMPEVGPDYVPIRNKSNDYLIDREDQKTRTYTGVRGVAEQDAMIQESQGVIADRTREILVATDAAIARFRKAVLDGARALAQGEVPAQARNAEAYTLRSGSLIVDSRLSLEEVMQQRFGNPLGRFSFQAEQAEAPTPQASTSTG